MAELEELGVGVFEELDGGLGADGGVVEKSGVPADDGEVGGIVGDAGLEDLVALAFGELEGVAADDLGDAGAVGGDEPFRRVDGVEAGLLRRAQMGARAQDRATQPV